MKKAPEDKNDYYYFLPIQTRWMDNDVYGHVNNVTYYSYFDTVANHFLIEQAGLDIHAADIVGFVVASACEYYAPISYPQIIHAALRVNKIGSKSVEYGIAIFDESRLSLRASGTFTHVFVERSSGQSVAIPQAIRDSLESILIS
ncbi:MAG: thioesterase family protein [Pseudomonadota bacterium]